MFVPRGAPVFPEKDRPLSLRTGQKMPLRAERSQGDRRGMRRAWVDREPIGSAVGPPRIASYARTMMVRWQLPPADHGLKVGGQPALRHLRQNECFRSSSQIVKKSATFPAVSRVPWDERTLTMNNRMGGDRPSLWARSTIEQLMARQLAQPGPGERSDLQGAAAQARNRGAFQPGLRVVLIDERRGSGRWVNLAARETIEG